MTEIKVSGESWEKGQTLSSVVDCNQCPSLICHLLRHHAITRKNVCGAEVQHDETFSRWKQVNDTAESFTHRNSTLTFNSLSIHSVKPMSDCYRDVSCAHFRFDLQTKFKTRFLQTVWLFPARLTASVSQFDFLLVTYPVSKISDLLFQSLDSKVYCVQHLRDHCNINTKYLPTY